jgi:hypothetical protein
METKTIRGARFPVRAARTLVAHLLFRLTVPLCCIARSYYGRS